MNKPVLLAVDDDPQVLAAVRRDLRARYRDQYAVLSAASGDEALAAIRELKPRPLFQTPFIERAPRLSPDGRWLAYESNESGNFEVYVQPFPGLGAKTLVSTDGGTQAVWARSGRELFYRNGDKVIAVAVETQPVFKAGTPRTLFDHSGFETGSKEYDVSPDGQKFLMVKIPGGAGTFRRLIVVQHWFEELTRLVPK